MGVSPTLVPLVFRVFSQGRLMFSVSPSHACRCIAVGDPEGKHDDFTCVFYSVSLISRSSASQASSELVGKGELIQSRSPQKP